MSAGGSVPSARAVRIGDALTLLAALLVAHGAWFFFDVFSAQTDWLIHYRWATDFAAALEDGTLRPVWSSSSRGGLGDPVFLYYMPLFYYFTSAVAVLTGNIWWAIKIVTVASVGASGLLVLLFARSRGLGTWTARLAGVLAIALSFVVVLRGYINAYPWVLANLFLLAATIALLHYLERPGPRRGALLAALTGALCLTHTLTSASFLLMAGGAMGMSWLTQDRSWAGFAGMLRGAGYLVLGMGLSAMALLPAVAELDLVTPSAWDHEDPRFSAWFNSFVFPVVTDTTRGLFSYVLPAGTLLLVPFLALAAWTARPLEASERTILWMGALALFLTSELSWPLWAILEPLQIFQRPFRFVAVATAAILVAGIALLSARTWRPGSRRLAAGAACLALLPTLPLVADMALDIMRGAPSRQVVAEGPRMDGVYGQPEHLPRSAGDWEKWIAAGGWTAECAAAGAECERAGQLSWRVTAPETTRIRLPLMAFPGWQIEVGDAEARPVAELVDPGTGLVRLDLPAGATRIKAEWHSLPGQVAGGWISAASLVVLLGLAGWGFARARGKE